MSARLKLAEVIGPVFYIGKMPFAPGTWGSLAALISWYLLKPSMSDPLFLLITGGIFFIGIAVSAILTKEWQQKDPKEIVIDEWVGMWIALYLCPHDFKWGLVSFLFFRIFDIFKPGPVQLMDNMKNGAGVMLDDIVAGILALFITQSLYIFAIR